MRKIPGCVCWKVACEDGLLDFRRICAYNKIESKILHFIAFIEEKIWNL